MFINLFTIIVSFLDKVALFDMIINRYHGIKTLSDEAREGH